MKSIYFNQAPNMRGKLTMRYTDITIENFRPKVLAKAHRDDVDECLREREAALKPKVQRD